MWQYLRTASTITNKTVRKIIETRILIQDIRINATATTRTTTAITVKTTLNEFKQQQQ